MRKSNDQTLGEVIQELIAQYKLEGKLNSIEVINSWQEVVGKMIFQHTRNLYVKNRTLFVTLDSAALKNELSFAKTKIINALNEKVGTDSIKEIVFL